MRGCNFFLGDIGFNLFAVGVIVRQRGVHLGEGQMRIFEGNFLQLILCQRFLGVRRGLRDSDRSACRFLCPTAWV
jgi:hypothetical protein